MNTLKILVLLAVASSLVEVRAQALSADGSTLTVAQSQAGGSLVTAAGRWTLGQASNVYGAQSQAGGLLVTSVGWTFAAGSNAFGNTVLLNTTVGFATLLEVAGAGELYAQAADGSWWRWNNPG